MGGRTSREDQAAARPDLPPRPRHTHTHTPRPSSLPLTTTPPSPHADLKLYKEVVGHMNGAKYSSLYL
ncbi:MAG: hypothetical protein ABGY24_04345 [bacterium]